jgi:hypothetical protein
MVTLVTTHVVLVKANDEATAMRRAARVANAGREFKNTVAVEAKRVRPR